VPLESSSPANAIQEWHWEGHIQAALARWLTSQGWEVTREADTLSRAAGVDLAASRDGQALVVEVKGYPSATYARGEKAGQAKPTRPATQARQWYSHALLAAMLLRHEHPGANVALCFPEFATYRSLIDRTADSLSELGLGLYLVGIDGGVDVRLEPGKR
jgi:Holliday junction resolvase-like predicted endonuclease